MRGPSPREILGIAVDALGSRSLARFHGYDVLTHRALLVREQHRFPRSRKRRIREKWERRARNWRTVPDPSIYEMVPPPGWPTIYGGRPWLVMHPDTLERLQRAPAAVHFALQIQT